MIYSGNSEAEHLANLKRVLQKLKEHGVRIKKDKCAFMKMSVQYLGHLIDADGIHATDDKLKAIVDAPPPQDVS
jgi:ACT domain-containing protein